jgi:hypothetical protein
VLSSLAPGPRFYATHARNFKFMRLHGVRRLLFKKHGSVSSRSRAPEGLVPESTRQAPTQPNIIMPSSGKPLIVMNISFLQEWRGLPPFVSLDIFQRKRISFMMGFKGRSGASAWVLHVLVQTSNPVLRLFLNWSFVPLCAIKGVRSYSSCVSWPEWTGLNFRGVSFALHTRLPVFPFWYAQRMSNSY